MKAVTYAAHGGPEVLAWRDVAMPDCHPKGVLIEVHAVSVEGGDLLDRSGNFAPLADHPLILGRQAAGVIVALGAEVEGLNVGQRVVGVRPNGSHAQFFAPPARTTWPIPASLSLVDAAALPIAFATAFEALHHYARLSQGETVLIHGASGGVGVAAVQLARLGSAGVVLATSTSDTRLDRLSTLGADHLINCGRTDVREAVMEITRGRGVDVLVDMVGGRGMQASLQCMARNGRLVAVGQASRSRAKVDLSHLYSNGVTLCGLKLDIVSPRVRDAVFTLLHKAADRELKVMVDRTFPLSQAAEAHAYVESRQAFGRVVLLA